MGKAHFVAIVKSHIIKIIFSALLETFHYNYSLMSIYQPTRITWDSGNPKYLSLGVTSILLAIICWDLSQPDSSIGRARIHIPGIAALNHRLSIISP